MGPNSDFFDGRLATVLPAFKDVFCSQINRFAEGSKGKVEKNMNQIGMYSDEIARRLYGEKDEEYLLLVN